MTLHKAPMFPLKMRGVDPVGLREIEEPGRCANNPGHARHLPNRSEMPKDTDPRNEAHARLAAARTAIDSILEGETTDEHVTVQAITQLVCAAGEWLREVENA